MMNDITAILTVCDLPEGVLQQVFDDGQGYVVVGEIAVSDQNLGMAKVQGTNALAATVFAPRVREALTHWRGSLLLRLTPTLAGLPWMTYLAQLGVQADCVRQTPSQFGEPQANSLSAPDTLLDQVASHAIAARGNRHVTSISYDLVGSTELMASMGAEAYAQLLSQLHRCFAEIALTWGGASRPSPR